MLFLFNLATKIIVPTLKKRYILILSLAVNLMDLYIVFIKMMFGIFLLIQQETVFFHLHHGVIKKTSMQKTLWFCCKTKLKGSHGIRFSNL
ncbi:MAG TPA: hypothetical protein DEF92_07765 [Leclercia adecarboxylata]|nr:hypothetical protein [Leclercia adecarboxylata]